MIRGICLAAALLAALPAMIPARASAQAAPPEKIVTLNLKRVPFRKAVELTFSGSSLQYSIAPNVPDTPVDLAVRELPVSAALRLLTRLASTPTANAGA